MPRTANHTLRAVQMRSSTQGPPTVTASKQCNLANIPLNIAQCHTLHGLLQCVVQDCVIHYIGCCNMCTDSNLYMTLSSAMCSACTILYITMSIVVCSAGTVLHNTLSIVKCSACNMHYMTLYITMRSACNILYMALYIAMCSAAVHTITQALCCSTLILSSKLCFMVLVYDFGTLQITQSLLSALKD